jgi:hypothetical protein
MQGNLGPPHERERLVDQRRLEFEQRVRRDALERSFAYVALGAIAVYVAVELVRYLVQG